MSLGGKKRQRSGRCLRSSRRDVPGWMVGDGDSFVWQGETSDVSGRREQLGNVLGCEPAHCLFAFQLPTQKRHLVFEAYCRHGRVVCPSCRERSLYRPVRTGRI